MVGDHGTGVVSLNGEKFALLMEVLKILERHEKDPEVVESAMEIIESFEDALTPEQRSEVLREFLHFKKHGDSRKQHFQEAERKEELRDFGRADYF